MSGRSFLLFLVAGLFLSACMPVQTPPSVTSSSNSLPNITTVGSPSPTPETQPVNPSQQQATPGVTPTPDYAPQPGDETLSRADAYVNTAGITTQGSSPVQFFIDIKGDLPTPCNQLRIMVNAPDSQNRIMLEVYSVADPNRICTQVLKPFEQTVLLGNFPGGHYTVFINGKQIGEFTA